MCDFWTNWHISVSLNLSNEYISECFTSSRDILSKNQKNIFLEKSGKEAAKQHLRH